MSNLTNTFFREIFEVKVKEMKTAITKMDALSEIVVDIDMFLWAVLMDAEELIETVKQHVKVAILPEMVRILWDVLMDAFQCSGKNQELALRQVKTWAKLLIPFCTTGKLQLELLYKVQVECYKDTKLKNLFPAIVQILYDKDVLAEVVEDIFKRRQPMPQSYQGARMDHQMSCSSRNIILG